MEYARSGLSTFQNEQDSSGFPESGKIEIGEFGKRAGAAESKRLSQDESQGTGPGFRFVAECEELPETRRRSVVAAERQLADIRRQFGALRAEKLGKDNAGDGLLNAANRAVGHDAIHDTGGVAA